MSVIGRVDLDFLKWARKNIPVKSLFTIANSFAPAASNIANAMITSPANKSG